MKILLLMFVLLFATLAAGCSSSYIVSSSLGNDIISIEEFNTFANGKNGTLTLEKSTGSVKVSSIQVISDSLFWIDDSGLRMSTATDQIKEVVFTETSIWKGIGYGVLGGAVTGFVWAVIRVPNMSSGSAGMEGLAYIAYPILGIFPGAFIGGFTGGIIGNTYRYTFQKGTR